MSDPREPGVPAELTCDDVRELSGSFVLGALTPAEEADVRAHLSTCDDAHAEIEALGGVLPVLNESVPIVEPPVGLRDRILAAAAAEPQTVVPAPIAVPAPTVVPGPTAIASADERSARRARASTGTWILRIAAVLAIVARRLEPAPSQPARHCPGVSAVRRPGPRCGAAGFADRILTPDGGTGRAWPPGADGVVTIAMQDLAPTTGGTVYEAWVIASDGVPVPLGHFTVGTSKTGTLTASGLPTNPGIVLALTLEPGPGATTPTMPIISKGVASPAG
jgi:anti-sigma-K factor RskA